MRLRYALAGSVAGFAIAAAAVFWVGRSIDRALTLAPSGRQA